jgi:hypothetical protein
MGGSLSQKRRSQQPLTRRHYYPGTHQFQLISSNSIFKILKSRICNNGLVGIHLIGEFALPEISSNIIENNKGQGIIVGVSNKAKVLTSIY